MLRNILPDRFRIAINNLNLEAELIEEIRIRLNRQAYLVTTKGTHFLNVVASASEIEAIFLRITGGSLYAHRDTLNKGFITLDNGVRVGVAGRAGIENGNIIGVYDISELSFRIPNNIRVRTDEIIKLINGGITGGILIYSPPGIGKTTLLRSLAYDLSSGREARRTCIIDTRGEISYSLNDKRLLISTLINYPRKAGIEIAIRNLNPQIIICDEIGDEEEANSILKSQSSGVILIATAHARSITNLLSREVIKKLHKAAIFDYYIGIERSEDYSFEYNVTSWEMANDI